MESYTYKHFPDRISNVFIALFSSVKNAAELRTRIVKAATMEGREGDAEREAVNFAFIDAKLVCILSCIAKTVKKVVLTRRV